MRRLRVASIADMQISIPRGWVVVFAALASWALVIAAGNLVVQLFGFLLKVF